MRELNPRRLVENQVGCRYPNGPLWTVRMVGFEPTASRVRGEHSNQTELHPVAIPPPLLSNGGGILCAARGSNPRPRGKSPVLMPSQLAAHTVRSPAWNRTKIVRVTTACSAVELRGNGGCACAGQDLNLHAPKGPGLQPGEPADCSTDAGLPMHSKLMCSPTSVVDPEDFTVESGCQDFPQWSPCSSRGDRI